MPAEPQTSRRTEEREEPKEEPKPRGLEARIAELEAALAASRGAAPLNPIPANGAGPGTDVAETWSLFEQQEATLAASKK